jgi:DNA polymerase theta
MCEIAAKHVAKLLDIPDRAALAEPGPDGDRFDRSWLTAELGRLPGKVEENFSELLPKGVAYHHAGLTTEERELVEQGYSKGTSKSGWSIKSCVQTDRTRGFRSRGCMV